ncbi:multidrug efflux pump subunit AcrB [Rubricella aquisinus]|uniref:Multidrug efflux pump subunit AcrB n=1 Tax=Rubricella aquisinus TaxID=2028108 RepID=A0A840X2H1_9RHOB|nr:efflux RND transporter permease subunit [Rubricella aquisinus]MBB5516046.1 multidrug efflux pump subunit AcrB [Rubricella aquisinus]
MDIARTAIVKPLYTWLLIAFCVFGGLWGFSSVGRLEDPAFTIKAAVVITPYPGATAEEVATEVTEPLESAIQQMGQIDRITSRNQAGLSQITVEMKPTYDGTELPQIWDELRNKVGDAAGNLPAGARPPIVNDAFGDVFGILYAVETPGYSDAQIHEIANFLRRELLAVDGVADVELQGLPEEAIFVEPSSEQTANFGVPPGAIIGAINASDQVQDAGSTESAGRSIQLDAPQGYDSVSRISSLTLGVGGEIINLTDLAEVYRTRVDDPDQIIRFDGVEAFTLGVAGLSSENIVDVGRAVDAKLAELQTEIPFGVTLHSIYEQHTVVDEASNSFLISLAMSVSIVIIVLAVAMGWRAAAVVGITLLLTVISTFFFMSIFNIEMERISLGALIIAMGMLVDNAIVVAEGMQVEMRKGRKAHEAAKEVASKTQIPLLGATIIGIMAFAGIGLSPDATGEFLFSLFAVIGISLMLSWVLAVTVTPLLAHYLFRVGGLADGEDAYGGIIFRGYAATLRGALRVRWLVILALIGITAACFVAFGQVKQQFFPNSNTPIFYLNYKLAQGSTIHQTSDGLAQIEDWLLERDDVVSVTTTVGQGISRYMLPYEPGRPDPSYGQLLIRTQTIEEIPPLKDDLQAFIDRSDPTAEIRLERIIFGPGGGADVEARFSGKDPDVLRHLAEQAEAIFRENDRLLHTIRDNWREREPVIRPIYATDRAQALGVDRDDVASTLLIATDGLRAGQFQERDRIIPIYVRAPEAERANPGYLLDQIVWSDAAQDYVPLAQVIDGFEIEVSDTLLHRRNRLPTITVQGNTVDGVTPATAFAEVRPLIEAIDLPVGYALEWGGEYENSTQAQESLGQQLPLSLLVMVLISILLFGALRQPLVIWLLVPMSVNGVAVGLLATGLPFSFTALLGLLSLSGMLIKNGIVLVEEIDLQRATGLPQTEAIVTASVSRLRPVVLAAGTTILGMIPLLTDAFFASMAVTIMGGLAFASVLTLLAAPVFYHTLFRKGRREERMA